MTCKNYRKKPASTLRINYHAQKIIKIKVIQTSFLWKMQKEFHSIQRIVKVEALNLKVAFIFAG